MLKNNESNVYVDYPYASPCGKERNYVKVTDTPVVFWDILLGNEKESKKFLTSGENLKRLLFCCLVFFLHYAGTLKILFQPHLLRASSTTGKLYHPFETKK